MRLRAYGLEFGPVTTGDLDVLEVLGSSDDVLPLVAAAASGEPSEVPLQPPSQPPSPAPERRNRRSRASTRTPEASNSREPSQARGAGSPSASQPRRRTSTPNLTVAPSNYPQASEAPTAEESISTAALAEERSGAGALALSSSTVAEGVDEVAACGPAACEQGADQSEGEDASREAPSIMAGLTDHFPDGSANEVCGTAVGAAAEAGDQVVELKDAQTAEKEDVKQEVVLTGVKTGAVPKSVGLVASAISSPVLAAQTVAPFVLLPDMRVGPEAEE